MNYVSLLVLDKTTTIIRVLIEEGEREKRERENKKNIIFGIQ